MRGLLGGCSRLDLAELAAVGAFVGGACSFGRPFAGIEAGRAPPAKTGFACLHVLAALAAELALRHVALR